MSSEYFCKVALARASNRSSRQLNKQANAAMNFKKAITGPLGGMLAGAGVAGGVGLHSLKGLQQELSAAAKHIDSSKLEKLKLTNELAKKTKEMAERDSLWQNTINKLTAESPTAGLSPTATEKLVKSLDSTSKGLSNTYGGGSGSLLDDILTSAPATTAVSALNKANDYTSGVWQRLHEVLNGHSL